MIALKGSVITSKEIIKDGVVVIDGAKIAYVGPMGTPCGDTNAKCAQSPQGVPNMEIIDCRGKFISPGFIDLHVQGAGGCDILDGNYEAVNTISKALAANGVTAFLATTVYFVGAGPCARPSQGNHRGLPLHLAAVAQAIRKGTQGARVLGVHLEGPFINPLKCGMIKKENIAQTMGTLCGGTNVKYARPPQGVPDIDAIIDACGGALKMMTIAPEMPGAIEIIKQLKKNKIVAAIGHTNATYDETIKGFDAGITHATHVFNAMRSLHHREPGAVGAVLTDDRVSVQLIADGKHLHPAVVGLVIKQKDYERTALITDSMSAAGLPDGRYVYNDLKYESNAGLAVYFGTDTFIGTALTLNKIVKRVVAMGKANLQQAVLMASIVPARVLGIDNRKGSIVKGKDADIVVIDKDCDVSMTIIDGKILKK